MESINFKSHKQDRGTPTRLLYTDIELKHAYLSVWIN